MTLVHVYCSVRRREIPSLPATVAKLVEEMGQATAEDLLPKLEGFNREQVMQALKNAKRRGMVECGGREWSSGRRGNTLGVYRSLEQPKPEPKPVAPVRLHQDASGPMKRPPNSAWELCADLRVPGGWPPTDHTGRRYELMGSWD